MNDLITHYSNYDEDIRLTKRNVTRIEFDTTIHTFFKYFAKKQKLTEIGAGTGRYSLFYASIGYDVTAVELVPDFINTIKTKAKKDNLKLKVHEGNATDVSIIPSQSQDIVLVLGPLYHLKKESDRIKVIRESKRILKKGGILAIAYINKYFVANQFAEKHPELIDTSTLDELLHLGTVSNKLADSFFKIGYFSSPDESENLIRANGFEILEHLATDSISRFVANGVDNFNEDQYKIWLDFHLKTCQEKSMLGLSQHGLIIGEKK